MSTEKKTNELDTRQLRRLACLYYLEQYLFEIVSSRFAEQQTLTSYDFFAIIVWKSNRSKTNVRDGLLGAGKSPVDLMAEVAAADTPKGKIETLLEIWGIGLPIASAILTVCHPHEFTILDDRVWRTLKRARVDGLPDYSPTSPEDYLRYCQVCKRLAVEKEMSLRDLDRALWAKSWEDDLRRLIDEQ